MPKVLSEARYSGHGAPNREGNRNEVSPIATVRQPRDGDAKGGVKKGEGKTGEHTQCGIG